jgi:membrane associated rhomboid family serine protease
MTARRRSTPTWDTWLYLGAIAVINLPLVVAGHPSVSLVLFPDAVRAGEWWRLVLHPFVHVSLWHLALDGLAFVLLMRSLDALRPLERLVTAATAASTSAFAASLNGGELAVHGLCGLSGSAHGLMAASGLLMLRYGDESDRRVGRWLVGLVSLKALFEAVSGQILFEPLYFGRLGFPNAFCHLGGVLGGLLVASLVGPRLARRSRAQRMECAALTAGSAGESGAAATSPFRPGAHAHPAVPCH